MNRLLSLTLLALALSGCSLGVTKPETKDAAPQRAGLVGQASRIVDSLIAHDQKTFDGIQLRLRRLNESGIPQSNYSLAKAQCWLDTAGTQHSENDRTGYVEDSLAESVRIIQALETDRNSKAGYQTPLVARSSRVRSDLWTQLAGFRSREDTLACTARTVACAEVRLVRAGHAETQTGWRQATPHILMVEDAVRRANADAASCNAPLVASTAKPGAAPANGAAAVPTAPAQTVTVTVTKETFVILADTLFRFDKSGSDDMLPGGMERLTDLVRRLKAYPAIQSMAIVGHTDRLGSDAYNDELSRARADTVKAFFEAQGIKPASSSAKGAGKREPVSRDCSDRLGRDALVQCLQPDRRVTIEITAVPR